MNALITGITGQDGAYLAKLLVEKGYDVTGVLRNAAKKTNLEKLQIVDKINLVELDLQDSVQIKNLITALQPDEVYNLVAQSHVGKSWDNVSYTTKINCVVVADLLEAIRLHSPNTKFLQAGSCAVYGNSTQPMQDENTSFAPQSPYAITKAYSHWLVENYRTAYSLFSVNAILFSHESALRNKNFVTKKITDFISQVRLGHTHKLKLGNIDALRDFGHAKDYVQAMWLMLQQNVPEDFVIGTGKTHSIKDILDTGFASIGIYDWSNLVEYDRSLERPSEVKSYCANISKAKHQLGWYPQITFAETILEMINDNY